jgi:hypothetical protein
MVKPILPSFLLVAGMAGVQAGIKLSEGRAKPYW